MTLNKIWSNVEIDELVNEDKQGDVIWRLYEPRNSN